MCAELPFYLFFYTVPLCHYSAMLAPEQVKSINPSWINIEVVTQKEFSLFITHESF